MRTAILSLLIGFCGALLYPERALSCWVDISLEEVVQKSSLVVVGTIERVERATLAADVEEHAGLWHSRPIDVAYIKVDRVLKAQGKHPFAVPGGQIPLGMPSVHRNFIGGADIVYGKGQRGVWLLELHDGKYWATYPKDLQEVQMERKIEGIIRAQSSGR